MTALILLGQDFPNLKQYSLSKLFQLSLILVNRFSFVDGDDFIFNFHHKISFGFRLELSAGHVKLFQ